MCYLVRGDGILLPRFWELYLFYLRAFVILDVGGQSLSILSRSHSSKALECSMLKEYFMESGEFNGIAINLFYEYRQENTRSRLLNLLHESIYWSNKETSVSCALWVIVLILFERVSFIGKRNLVAQSVECPLGTASLRNFVDLNTDSTNNILSPLSLCCIRVLRFICQLVLHHWSDVRKDGDETKIQASWTLQ